MHLHEEFSRSTSSIRMSGAAWQATVREVFGRSVARKYFWMLLANLRACEVKVFPSYSPKVGSGQRFHPQPTKGEGEGERGLEREDGRLTALFVIAIAVFSIGSTSSTSA